MVDVVYAVDVASTPFPDAATEPPSAREPGASAESR